jgi:hypothetical protein
LKNDEKNNGTDLLEERKRDGTQVSSSISKKVA